MSTYVIAAVAAAQAIVSAVLASVRVTRLAVLSVLSSSGVSLVLCGNSLSMLMLCTLCAARRSDGTLYRIVIHYSIKKQQ